MDQRERTQNLLQDMMDGGNARAQKERAESGQLTLGQFIDLLEHQDRDRGTLGFGKLESYRGYYCDLAFNPDNVLIGEGVKPDGITTVAILLAECRAAMGKVFEGYKGGDFPMSEATPLWVSPYGETTGDKIVGLDSTGVALMPRIVNEYTEEKGKTDPRTPEAIALERVANLATGLTKELIDEKRTLARAQEWRREERTKRKEVEQSIVDAGMINVSALRVAVCLGIGGGIAHMDASDEVTTGYLIPFAAWEAIVKLAGLDVKAKEVAGG